VIRVTRGAMIVLLSRTPNETGERRGRSPV
jgi:hypothetical protein